MRGMTFEDPARILQFFENDSALAGLDILIPDINGILRGKRVDRKSVAGFAEHGVKLPRSLYWLNSQGENTAGIFGDNDGDPDGHFRCVAGSLEPIPWAGRPRLQCLAALDGAPTCGDSRRILQRVVDGLEGQGLRPCVAVEFEFYLLDPSSLSAANPQPATLPGGLPLTTTQCHDMKDIDALESCFDALEQACAAQHIPSTTVCSEYAPGQFEINLAHSHDIVAACDQALLLKRAIRALGFRHGLIPCFMSKPFAEHAGSGLHVHCSILQGGENIFEAGTDFAQEQVGEALRHAVGGLQSHARESVAVFASNGNAYRRFRPGSFAPVNLAWGIDNRHVAFRLPYDGGVNTRVEHRLAGAEANPYLVVALLLASLDRGLALKTAPGAMSRGGDVLSEPAQEFANWEAALAAFRGSAFIEETLGSVFRETYAAVKGQECRRYMAGPASEQTISEQSASERVPWEDFRLYLGGA